MKLPKTQKYFIATDRDHTYADGDTLEQLHFNMKDQEMEMDDCVFYEGKIIEVKEVLIEVPTLEIQ